MNNKFLPGAVLFIIAFTLSNLAFQTHVKAQSNTFYGEGAGANNSGGRNSGFGYLALSSGNSATENTAIGDEALYSNTTGQWNTASGAQALFSNTIGNYNTASGASALANNTTGVWNTAIGNPKPLLDDYRDKNTATGYNVV